MAYFSRRREYCSTVTCGRDVEMEVFDRERNSHGLFCDQHGRRKYRELMDAEALSPVENDDLKAGSK